MSNLLEDLKKKQNKEEVTKRKAKKQRAEAQVETPQVKKVKVEITGLVEENTKSAVGESSFSFYCVPLDRFFLFLPLSLCLSISGKQRWKCLAKASRRVAAAKLRRTVNLKRPVQRKMVNILVSPRSSTTQILF